MVSWSTTKCLKSSTWVSGSCWLASPEKGWPCQGSPWWACYELGVSWKKLTQKVWWSNSEQRNCCFASGNGLNFQVIGEQFPVRICFSLTIVMPMSWAMLKISVSKVTPLNSKGIWQQNCLWAGYRDLLKNMLWSCLPSWLHENRWPNLAGCLSKVALSISISLFAEFPGAHGIEDAWNATSRRDHFTGWTRVWILARSLNKSVSTASSWYDWSFWRTHPWTEYDSIGGY